MTLVPVQEDELDALHAMLHALAASEGVAQVTTTRADLARALFNPQPAAFAVWIQCGRERAGFVIYSWKWGTFTGTRDLYMQAVYLDPAHRRRGLGRAAMAELARIAQAEGCTRMEWLAVRNKAESQQFYDGIGATSADHMVVRRLPRPAMQALAASAELEASRSSN
jgi:GNAT superfamily N-acetyltransferase